MSLDWNVSNVKDFKTVCWSEPNAEGKSTINPVTNALIWLTMAIGIGEITEANASEVYARISIIEKLGGARLFGPQGDRPIQPADVARHIGLTTNVFPKESFAKWSKRILDGHMRTAQYEYRTQKETATV